MGDTTRNFGKHKRRMNRRDFSISLPEASSCLLREERADSEDFDEIPAHQDRVICLDSHQAEEWALCHLENYNKSSHL